ETGHFNKNHQLRAATSAQLAAVMADVDALLAMTTERVVRQQVPTADPAEHGKGVRTAVASNMRLWRVLFDEQDRMLHTRMSGDLRRRDFALASAAIAVLLSVIVAIVVLRSVTRPIKQVVDVAEKISRGEVPESLEWTDSKDEMGLLLRGIENMLKFLDLRNTIQTLQRSASMLDNALNDMDQQSTEAEQQITR